MNSFRPRHIGIGWLAAMTLVSAAIAEDLEIPGSGNPEYVLSQLAKAFNDRQGQHRVTVPVSTGTAGALRDVAADTASLGRVGRPLKDDERSKGFQYLAIGRDPVVFAAGAGVTAHGISQEQALAAYGGKITDWRELGGKSGPIRAIGREVTDASRQAVGRIIKPFANMAFASNVKVVSLDPHLIELLDRFPTSLGFINKSALAACKTKIVTLALDGVMPTPKNVEQGRYPLWLEFGLIYKSDRLTPAGKAFIEFIQSPAGTRILREHGVLPSAA